MTIFENEIVKFDTLDHFLIQKMGWTLYIEDFLIDNC